MDYEKAYKESFEAAKGLHDAGNALTRRQMEIVFPELAESEDEKIRKFLIDYFTSYKIGNVATKLNGYRIDDILAYLEKQKEQKPADEQFPPLEGLDAIKAKYYDDGFKNGFDEGVESVKPAEWDDYTKTNLGRAIQIIKDARGTLHGYQTDDGIYECDKAIEALEHFLYRGLEIEKSAEWSEEDEENMQAIVDTIKMHWLTLPGNTLIDWLKSLRPVSKEFLQRHWKPSEEQMKALEHFIRSWGESGTMSPQNTILCAANSLLTDLQKLL